MNSIIFILLLTVFTCAICDFSKDTVEQTASIAADSVSIVKDVSGIYKKEKPKKRHRRSNADLTMLPSRTLIHTNMDPDNHMNEWKDTLSIVKDVQNTLKQYKTKKRYRRNDVASIMLSNGTFIGVDKYPKMDPDNYKYVWEDMFFIEHDKNDLVNEITRNNVNPGDIVACLMSNGHTQHYAVVLNNEGTTAGFGEAPQQRSFSDVYDAIKKILTRVPGALLLMSVEALSQSYDHRCSVIPNKFSEHYAESSEDCQKKLDSTIQHRLTIMNKNVLQMRENKMFYNLKNCNCQMIAMYLAYQYRHSNMKCYINDDIIVEQTRGTSEEAVKREYMHFRQIC